MIWGFPSTFDGVFVQSSYDYFTDLMRGARGIVLDFYRQPEVPMDALEVQTNPTIKTVIKNFPMTR